MGKQITLKEPTRYHYTDPYGEVYYADLPEGREVYLTMVDWPGWVEYRTMVYIGGAEV